MKVCTFLMAALVVRHFSDPYRSTDFTFELKILILVFLLISLDLQMFLRARNDVLAFPILAMMSSSVPPFLLMMLPRYVKLSALPFPLPPSDRLAGLVVCLF